MKEVLQQLQNDSNSDEEFDLREKNAKRIIIINPILSIIPINSFSDIDVLLLVLLLLSFSDVTELIIELEVYNYKYL